MKSRWLSSSCLCAGIALLMSSVISRADARLMTDAEKIAVQAGADCETVEIGTVKCSDCEGPDGNGDYSKCTPFSVDHNCIPWLSPPGGSPPYYIQTCTAVVTPCGGSSMWYHQPAGGCNGMPFSTQTCNRTLPNDAVGGLKSRPSPCR